MAETKHLSQYPVPVHKTVLDNGLTVITAETGSAFCHSQVILRTGGVDDDPETLGLAHLAEHLHYQDDGSRGAHPLLKALTAKGVRSNAFTRDTMTVYHATGPSELVAETVGALMEIVFHRTFSQERVALERPIVVSELMEAINQVRMAEFECRLKYNDGSPWIHANAIGSETTIMNIDALAVASRRARDYVAENAALIVCGGISHAKALEIVSGMVFQRGQRRPIPPPPSLKAVTIEAQAPVKDEPSYITMYWELPDRTKHVLHPVAALLKTFLLNSHLGSLHRRLRNDLGLVYSLEADMSLVLGTCHVGATASSDKFEQIEAETRAALKRLAHDGVPSGHWDTFSTRYRLELIEHDEEMRGPLAWKHMHKVLRGAWVHEKYKHLPPTVPYVAADIQRYADILSEAPSTVLKIITP